jgi:hypothetical protein
MVEQQRRFDEDWRVRVVQTPQSVGLPFAPSDHATLAWAVLARAPRVALCGLLAELASALECRGTDHTFVVPLSRVLSLPTIYRQRLIASARGGEPVLDPKAVRWILCEIAAGEACELEALARWQPVVGTSLDIAKRVLFPLLGGTDAAPTYEQVLTAVWLLHDDFHGTEHDFDSKDGIVSGVTALGCATSADGTWQAVTERWRAIWSTPDDHRVVAGQATPPSVVRSKYADELGLDPVSWLAGIWLICMKWSMAVQPTWAAQGLRLATIEDELMRLRTETDDICLGSGFRRAFDRYLVADIETFGSEVRHWAPTHRGLGSLPQTESLACRNFPVLRLPGDVLVPISVNLVGERAAILHRWLLRDHFRGFQALNSAVGHMFEAYLDDHLVGTVGHNYRIISEAEISAVLGDDSRCDLIVVQGSEWLFLEVSLQTISRMAADGELSSLDELLLRYHHEADQVERTIARAGEIARAYGLALPRVSVMAVVVDTAAPHSPALMGRLWRMRPDRNPRFVVGVRELEGLASLAAIGWSMPLAVHRWQHQPEEGPLSVVSEKLGHMTRPRDHVTPEHLMAWLSDLPRDDNAAA